MHDVGVQEVGRKANERKQKQGVAKPIWDCRRRAKGEPKTGGKKIVLS